ncbi:hypothetical protein BaRGS_00008496 [Batillaria attramentaria]|uniref:Secreted protein n=1 Tax=Batillaria attramentaria TaxID=370345 RepID=A0ABD0LLG4_9CAEN
MHQGAVPLFPAVLTLSVASVLQVHQGTVSTAPSFRRKNSSCECFLRRVRPQRRGVMFSFSLRRFILSEPDLLPGADRNGFWLVGGERVLAGKPPKLARIKGKDFFHYLGATLHRTRRPVRGNRR